MPVVSLSAEEAPGHFGWLAAFVGLDMPASSGQTRSKLGWAPKGPGMIADLTAMRYKSPPKLGADTPKGNIADA